ncbi:MAG TPA: cyclodeaminase/cyclohydrolase family protein [Ignavibacteriaceae bacterium]|nr:cyclodeaminase/cyclohydrolase family protein [Ignavibacteriaceae bacterium]
MNTNTTLKNYLDELSSNSPTPGGGNVSALCGALACSLGMMVCNLTIGKKKYAEVENEMKELLPKLESAKNDFLKLAGEDNEAFNKVMEAFKLPKETEAEKKLRSEKIDEATFQAAIVPSQVVKTSRIALPYIETVAMKGNQNSLSDAGVAASLLKTAAEGAFLNVMINCSSLSNKIVGEELLKKSDVMLDEVKINSEKIIRNIKSKLNPVN